MNSTEVHKLGRVCFSRGCLHRLEYANVVLLPDARCDYVAVKWPIAAVSRAARGPVGD